MKKSKLLFPLVMAVVMMAMCPMKVWALEGSGTEQNPYLIASAKDWTDFINNGSFGALNSNVYVKLTGEFTVSSTLRRQVNNEEAPVYIDLDGQGNTITLAINETDKENTGLFAQVGGGSDIRNLKLKGSVTSNKKYMGSLCGKAVKKTIVLRNIISSATLNSTVNGDATAGGLIGEVESTTNVNLYQCGFAGTLNGNSKADKMCGMVGYRSTTVRNNPTVRFDNCFTNATFSNVKSGDNYAFMRNDGDNDYVIYDNCYYVNYGSSGKASDKSSGGPTSISSTNVSNGTLAYKLNGSTDGVALWYHNIDNGKTDSYPYPFVKSGSLYHGLVYNIKFHGNTSAKLTNYTHTITRHAAVTPTCTKDGSIEYWTCNHLNAPNYSNAAATTTVSGSITLAKYNHNTSKGHTLSYNWSGSTFDAGKCKGYAQCNACGSYFASNDLTITSNSYKAATCTEQGVRKWKATGTNSDYNLTYQDVSGEYYASKIKHVFAANDATQGVCTACNHGFIRYTWDMLDDVNFLQFKGAGGASLQIEHTFADGIGTIEASAPIVELGYHAFSQAPTITIPKTVTSIDNEFTYSVYLTSITVDANNSQYSSSGGVLFNKNQTTLLVYPGGNSATSYTIPRSVTTVREGVFKDAYNLEKLLVDANNSNYASHDGILYNKNKTELIVCPRGKQGTVQFASTVTSIGNSAFIYCDKLSGSLAIPNSVTSIGRSAFHSCYGFTGNLSIGSNVSNVGAYAFSDCKFTGSLTIPNSVTNIEEAAFQNCEGFSSLTIGNNVTSIGNLAFYFCSGFKGTLTIPNSVTSIGVAAFQNCTGFTGILTIGNSVAKIEADAFTNCSNVASVEMKSFPHIGYQVFKGVTDTKTIALSDDSYVTSFQSIYCPTLSAKPTYTRSIAASSNWGTLILPFEAKSDAEVQLYELTNVSGSTLTLSPVETVAANTPCIFKKKVAGATSVTFTANSVDVASAVATEPAAVDGLSIRGTYTATDVEANAGYMLDADKFVKTTAKTTLSPFRAYLAGAINGVSTLYLPGTFTYGDLNDDGKLTVADLTLLVQLLNSNGTITNPAADIDNSGSVTIDDIKALTNKMLELK